MVEYYINPSENVGIRASDMLLFEGNLYISTTDNGVLRYDLKEKEGEKVDERFDPEHLTLGKSLELDMVFFAPGDSTLSTASHHQLSGLVGVLQSDTTLLVQLTGHTAQDGEDTYLMALSEARARAVANFLREHGIAPQRIRAKGLGANELKIPTNPRSPKNRRVEIRLER
jgi:outer membrane protein OmpA-like peptidoglycan-associated protein